MRWKGVFIRTDDEGISFFFVSNEVFASYEEVQKLKNKLKAKGLLKYSGNAFISLPEKEISNIKETGWAMEDSVEDYIANARTL